VRGAPRARRAARRRRPPLAGNPGAAGTPAPRCPPPPPTPPRSAAPEPPPAAAGGAGRAGCVILAEGDPRPGAFLGRMSFGSFNPATEKMASEAELEVAAAAREARAADDADVSDRAMADALAARKRPPGLAGGGAEPRGRAAPASPGPQPPPAAAPPAPLPGFHAAQRGRFAALAKGGAPEAGTLKQRREEERRARKEKKRQASGYVSLSGGAAAGGTLRDLKRRRGDA